MAQAMAKARLGRFDIGDALAGDFVGRAVRRRAQRHRHAAEHGYALVEAERLDRDLTLVVEQRQHGVELPGAGAQEHGVGRKRALHRDALCLGARHGRRKNVDFLGAESAAVAGVRIKRGERDARLGKAGCPHGAIGQRQRVQHVVDGDVLTTSLKGMCEVTRAFQICREC